MENRNHGEWILVQPFSTYCKRVSLANYAEWCLWSSQRWSILYLLFTDLAHRGEFGLQQTNIPHHIKIQSDAAGACEPRPQTGSCMFPTAGGEACAEQRAAAGRSETTQHQHRPPEAQTHQPKQAHHGGVSVRLGGSQGDASASAGATNLEQKCRSSTVKLVLSSRVLCPEERS